MGPPSFGAGLRQTGSCLTRTHEKPSRSFHRGETFFTRASAHQLLTRERRETDRPYQLLAAVPQAFKKIRHFRIEVVVGFDRRRRAINEDRRRATERLAIMSVMGREQRQQKIQMRKFSSVIAER